MNEDNQDRDSELSEDPPTESTPETAPPEVGEAPIGQRATDPPSIEQRATDQRDSANLPFIQELTRLLPSHLIQQSVRMTRKGTFVEESAIAQVIEAYQRFIQAGTDRTERRSEEKVRRKLFGVDKPTVYYVLDGKRSLAGSLLAGSVGDANKLRLPLYQANLLDTFEEIHPRDAMIASYPHIKPRLSQHEGFFIEFEAGEHRYELDEKTLTSVIRVLRAEQFTLKENPLLREPLRRALPAVREFFTRLRPSPGGQRLLVPEQFRGRPGIRFLRHRGFVVLIEGEKRVVGMYEVKGKGLGRFVRQEIAALVQPDGTNRVRNFESKTTKVQFLGKVWSKGMSFHLHLRAYRLFEREALRAEAGPGRLPERYTVRDVLERLVGSFLRSQPAEEISILTLLGKRRQPFAKYRKGRGCIFIITDKNVLFSVLRIAGEPLDAPRRDHPGGHDRRREGGGRDDQRGGRGRRGGGRNDRRDPKERGGRRGEGRGDRRRDAQDPNRGGPNDRGPNNRGPNNRGPNDRRGKPNQGPGDRRGRG